MARILVVDDEEDMLILVRNILQKDGHSVMAVSKAEDVFKMDYARFELILLDVMMPGINGFELCEQIRNHVDVPIVFLTAKSMENDIMFGLGRGADDYITKPFGVGELRARVQAHLRREQREKRALLNIGGIHFNLSGKSICIQGEKINLTRSEYLICEYLVHNKGQVFSKERIYEKIYGYEGESELSSITEHIKNIRAKFKKYDVSPIETVWGIGYKWV